jgi:alpha-galactosidase
VGSELVLLRAAGTALVVDVAGPRPPRVLHWGADLGALDAGELAAFAHAAQPAVPLAAPDEAIQLTLVPAQADGWLGRPGLSGHRDGRWPYPRLELTRPVEVDAEAGRLTVESADREAGLGLRTELVLEPQGVLRVRHALTNTGDDHWTVERVETLLPVPPHAAEVLDFTGRWPRERSPQRGPFTRGTRLRENRRGRTGHDATGLLVAGTDGFGFGHGEVWAVHVGWSGNHTHVAERIPEGLAVIGGGELLAAGEVRLAPGETYQTPWTYFVWSGAGLDGLGHRLHRWLRQRPGHPRSPRPVVLNTWEAVYFDHRLDRLTKLADVAAGIGVERFVLDDGWFLARRDDHAGLGDWYVDPRVWPDGLHPLVSHVHGLGMQFGLWVEPEMVNPDSNVAREHPDWLLAAPGRAPILARDQYVLDLARPEVSAHLLERLDALVTEYRIDYLKWDHNRDLLEAVHEGHAGVHEQTLATYRLLDELRARHPALEIESCSSGGARIDLGILQHTDRVWASDTNDALERQAIQRWTGLLLPPELVGSHVGPAGSHTTGRVADLSFRAATALFGHAGIEWDITSCTEAELAALTAWIRLYRRLRPLLHSGDVVRADHPDPAVWVHGVVAADRSAAVYAYVTLATTVDTIPAPLRLPGLDPAVRYRVSVPGALAPPTGMVLRQPDWLRAGEVTLPGSVLTGYGLPAPLLNPAQALVLEVRARS